MFRSRKTNYNDSPSPIHCSNTNNVAIQAELNDYLGCILNCLSKYFMTYYFINFRFLNK